MHYTNDPREAIPSDQVFKIPGKYKDNAFKATKTHNHNNKGSDKPQSTLPLPLEPGTISLFQWTSIGQEHLEGTGEGQGRGQSRGNVARTDDVRAQRGIQGACFKCGQQGHFACDCPTKQKHANT